MSKRTERMSWSAAERINRKDTVIRQNNTELEELRSQYESLDICDCLLYTSPSPRDKRQSRMPSSA